MAKWALSSSDPIRGESRRLVRDVETGRKGFAAVHHSSDGWPQLYGTVYLPQLDGDGREVGLPDGTAAVATLDSDPEFV